MLRGDPRERSRWLAARCHLDAAAIWQWGVVERVLTGLLATKVGQQPIGREMLRAADHVAKYSALLECQNSQGSLEIEEIADHSSNLGQSHNTNIAIHPVEHTPNTDHRTQVTLRH